MGSAKLCVLLLLVSYTLAQQEVGRVEEQSSTCFLAKRFKNFRRFVYHYKVETFNGANGNADKKSGPKVFCRVEIDVPQTCNFILRTTECSLSEIYEVNEDGIAMYRPAAGAEAFRNAMARNPLKVTIEGEADVKLYPEGDEPVNILNIKRGIVSALMVPVVEEEMTKNMPTVHGACPTDFIVTDTVTDMTLNRDLSRCGMFYARRQTTSPMALITGMNFPLSKMISSTQTCSYTFDNKKYISGGACTETHMYMPLPIQKGYGINTVVKQTVILRETAKINDRIFQRNEENVKSLFMDVVEDKFSVQTKDAAMTTFGQLMALSPPSQLTQDREERAMLFYKLVSELRGLKTAVLEATVDEMMKSSQALAWQALVQCGTPECTSTMLAELRKFDKTALEVDAAVYALGLLPNPSRVMVRDMLAMAQYKQSNPIMYALSNVVRRLFQTEGVTPEIVAVSEFIASILGEDCAGDKDLTFLTLRVVGNMGDALEAAKPAIKTVLTKCMRQPATTLAVQLAAIQAFRRMPVTDEIRTNLQRVSLYPKGAVQKRLAAYLMLMKNPQDSDMEMLKKLLKQEQNVQVKSFVTSHIYNIITSTDTNVQKLGQKILNALQDIDIATHSEYTTKSRSYKLGVAHDNMEASIQGSLIFDPSSQLPREALLETTLKAFGYSMDIWELGIQGKGFEPTVEALFGKNGFFPDTVSKTLYWTLDKLPLQGSRHMEEGVQMPNLMSEITRNFNKLLKDLQSQESPEAMAYLRIMGAELGYIKASDLKFMAENAKMYTDIFMRILPTKVLANLMSSTTNEIFAHYIFMDNRFMMPTAAGLPLTFALSGTFTPGAKGGLRLSPRMNELVFKPSIGVEFVTKMGVNVPDFVESGIEMHTSMYHESALHAKITMENNEVKLSIPAPEGTTRVFSMWSRVMIAGAGMTNEIHHTRGAKECRPLFSGIKYCTQKLSGSSDDWNLFFLQNRENKFVIDIKPTGDVSEYTASIAYKALSEGKDGRQKVDSVKFALRAEGAKSTEATLTMKYNRNRNVFTSQVEIPDFDVEAGIKVGVTDSAARGKSITFEISNKNIPQLSLIGRAKVQPGLADGMVQVQLLIPSIKTDATVTANMRRTGGIALEIKSDVKLPETSSIQAVTFLFSDNQAEVQLMSNVNADTKNLVFYTEALKTWLGHFAEDIMDQQVVKTDMKMRHIFNKAVEASNIWMNKIKTDVPYVEILKNRIEEMEMPTMPENLFMNFESAFRYQFNANRLAVTIPLPLGGKSSDELRIPTMVSSPRIFVPELGLEFASQEIQIPTFTIPSEYDLTLPLMGMMEASAKVNSNYYNWEGTMSAGNNTADSPNFVAKFNIMANSPVEFLSFSTEGVTELKETEEETMKFTMDGSVKHMLMTTGFSVLETLAVTESVTSTGKYNVYANSPLGVDTTLTVDTKLALDSAMLSGEVNTDGSVLIGPMSASTTYLYAFSVQPAKRQARLESTLNVNSEILKHNTKMSLNFNQLKLTMHSNSVTNAMERMLRSQFELSAFDGQATLRFENQVDDSVNRAYSLLTASMNPSGLEINADASMNVFSSRATHKATLALNMNGLTTSCTTTAQHSPMTFENVIHGSVDVSGATLSLTTKGGFKENKAELSFEGKLSSKDVYVNGVLKGDLFEANAVNTLNFRVNEDGLLLSSGIVGSFNEMRTKTSNSLSLTLSSLKLQSKTDNFLNTKNSYLHDIDIKMEPFIASVMMKNALKVVDVVFINDAQFKVEPYNVLLAGAMTGTYLEQELKNTYEVKFEDMVFSTKCNTNGILLGVQLTHASDMEMTGLNMKSNNDFSLNLPNLRLASTVKTMAAPFTLNIDADFKSDGSVSLYGVHSGDIFSKFLLKAEPMLFTQSFEYRASTTHDIQRGPIKTSMENTINSILSLPEQSVSLKMTSKVNEHTFSQEVSAFNNAERIGVQMTGAASTDLFSDANENYAISGFVKYDKNSDSHLIQIPFMEHLPEILENVKTTLMRLMDQGIEMMKDMNTRYEISAKIQSKASELKEVINNFDFNMFVQNLRRFARSMETFISKMTAKFPIEEVKEVVRSVIDIVMAWIRKYNIANKFEIIHAKVEEILSSYEVEKMIETVIDEIVKIMKQYQVREHIQNALTTFQEIDIQSLIKSAMVPFQRVIIEVQSFNFKQLIDDISAYFMGLIQQIQSFDYDTFTNDLKENLLAMSKIPSFGKLYGEFRVNSPHYNLRTTADIENTTTTSVTPEFKMNLNSQAKSTVKFFEFTVDASAHIAAPKMKRLTISENINVFQSCFELDHKGTMTIYGLSAQASVETTANATTELYVGKIINKASFAIESGVSAHVETHYKQEIMLNMPVLNFLTEATMDQKTVFILEDGSARLTMANVANGKYALQDIEDEATHKSDMEVAMDLHTAKMTFTGATGSSNFKMNENVVAEICIFRHIIFEAKVVTEMPFIRNSIAEAKLQAKVEDLRIDFSASHKTELLGQAEGIISNSVQFLLMPIEVVFDTKNNAEVVFPLIMSGEVGLQNDMAFTVNTEVQKASWTGLATVNQHKYSHHFSMENGDKEININSEIKGQANLDVLKMPIPIPEITLPFVGTTMTEMEEFSLWFDTGLSYFLITTEQTFDLKYKLKYVKNTEMIAFDINVEPLITAINTNVKTLHKKFLIGKDQAAAMMVASFDNAKAQYEMYSIELPKTITVPSYKVPVFNVEMSTFTIPLPDLSLITMPSFHLPSALSKLTLPKVTLPGTIAIRIPVMGDLTSEFSIKTAMIAVKSDASILNRDNFIVTFDASSSSECECLNGAIKGNTNVDTSKGFKIVNALSVKHLLAEGNHQSTLVLNYDKVATSLTNSAKLLIADSAMEFIQEVAGSPEEGLVVSVSSPSAGLIAVQMQTKRPAQVKARLYGRYPSEPTADIEIVGVKMSVINFEKLNLQTTWNMEMPYEMMLRMKNQVPVVMETVYEPAVMTYRELHRSVRIFEGSLEDVKDDVKTVFDKVFSHLAAVRRSDFVTTLAENTISVFKVYQKKIETIMGAVVTFLRETKFLIPGHEERLSGLEIYQKCTAFVADVSEEAIVKIPEYFTSMSTMLIDYIRSIEFTLPGSNYVVIGGEILDDLSVAMRKIQNQVIVTVKKLRNIQLEDIITKFNAFMSFTVEQSERFLQTLKSDNVEKFYSFVSDMYTDVMNSQVMVDVSRQIVEFQRIVMEYFEAIRSKLENVFADMSTQQLQSDIQSWIDVLVKRLNAFQNNVIKTLKEKSKSVQPFVRVSDRQMDIDIPLPFVAKFN